MFFLCNITSKILGSLSRQRLYMYIWNISRVICVLWKVNETFDLQHLITDAFHIRIVLWVHWYTISKADNSNLQVYLFTDYLDISRVFYIQWIWLYLLDIHSLFLYFKENCCRQNTIMSQFFCLTSKMC